MATRSRDDLALHLLHGVTLAAVLAGLVALRGTEIGADPVAALTGVTGQLATTLPAAVLVALAGALNLGAGLVLVRLVAGEPLRSPVMAALAGLGGAVLLDGLLFATLGSVGQFRWPLLALANLALVALGLAAARPILAREPRQEGGRGWPVAWLVVLLIWTGPLLLQLASPVVPFLDVLPNHVAPVEHLRAFGGMATIDTTPSPIYGPSRIFLGYQSLLGVIVTLGAVPAVTGVGAFALPLTLLVAAAGYGLARAIGGPGGGMWALLLVPLSVTFLRLADARAGVVAFPLAALALWLLLEPVGAGRRRQLVLGAVVAAAILVHPLIGLLTAAAAGLLAVTRARLYGWSVLPLLAAPLLGLGQWLAMLGLDVPPWFGLAGVPAAAVALAVGWRLEPAAPNLAVAAERVRRLLPAVAVVAVGVAAAGILLAPAELGRMVAGIGGVIEWYAALLAGAVLALLFGRDRPGWQLPWAAVAVSALAGAAVSVVPTGSVLGDSLRFELPKTLTYFGPTFLAVAAAVGLAAVWQRAERPLVVRALVVGSVLVLAAAPIRPGTVHELSLGEHRLAESLSISLRNASTGYWRGFPDPRRLIDAPQAELVDVLRLEITAGRLTGTSDVLHVARSFQPWVAAPLAAFAGVIETSATLDPEDSIHTVGGRLEAVADLPRLLADDYAYVVLEPDGLGADVAASILSAGYREIYAGDGGSVHSR